MKIGWDYKTTKSWDNDPTESPTDNGERNDRSPVTQYSRQLGDLASWVVGQEVWGQPIIPLQVMMVVLAVVVPVLTYMYFPPLHDPVFSIGTSGFVTNEGIPEGIIKF